MPVPPNSGLALAELEALAGAFLSVLLTLFAAGIAGEHAFRLELLAQFKIEDEQCAGNTHADCVRLSVDAAAGTGGEHIEVGLSLMVILPLPGRKKTRATLDLRRPVP